MTQPPHPSSLVSISATAVSVSDARFTVADTDYLDRRNELLVVGSALVALALKLIIALNTFGTNDVIALYQFGTNLTQHGLKWTYQNTIAFNHPPLAAYVLEWIYRLSNIPALQQLGLTFPFLVRLPGIVADFGCVLVLLAADRRFKLRVPVWTLLLFALSPVSLMVSGFHGNTDPVMVLFLVLAAYMVLANKPVVCGFFFALSCHIKIVPLLFFPIFLLFWSARGSTLRFLVSFIGCILAFWGQPLIMFPTLLFKNVLSYGSFWGLWGVTYWLRLTAWPEFARVTFHHFSTAETVVATLLKLLIIGFVVLIAWRTRNKSANDFLFAITQAWIVFFVFSPGVCAQYMVWLAPFVVLSSATLYLWLTLTSTLFLFFFYNTIADHFPWYLGISQGEHNEKWLPWSIWPWAVLVVAMILMCRRYVFSGSLVTTLSNDRG